MRLHELPQGEGLDGARDHAAHSITRQHQPARDEDDEQQAERQEDLPAEPHQLVVAVARHGRLHPAEDEEEEAHLGEQPDDARDSTVERRPVERRQPAAPEQDGVERAHQEDVGIFAEPEEREAHRRIFGLVAGDELALRLDQVERRAERSRPSSEIRNTTAIGNSSGLKPKPLRMPKTCALLRHRRSSVRLKRAGPEHDADQDEADRDFVADHLRRGAQRARRRDIWSWTPSRR